MPDTDQRLARIETDISGIKSALTDLVRMEERLINYQESMRRLWVKVESQDSRISQLELSAAGDKPKLDIAGRIVWLVVGVAVTGLMSGAFGG